MPMRKRQPVPDDIRQAANLIIEGVAELYGVTKLDVFSRRKTGRTVEARHAAINAVKAVYRDMSCTALAEIFDRNHTMILFALGRTKAKPRATWR